MNIVKKYPYIILFLITFVVYFQTLFYDISYCDDITILETQYNRISSINRIDDEFLKGYLDTDYYRPLVNISFILDASLGGREPFFYHLNNVIYHILIILLIYNILIKLKFDHLNSLLLSTIIAIHPILLNAVAWIPGRNDLLLTLFSLISFNFIIDYVQSQKYHHLLISLVAFFLALLSKETAAVLLILFAIYSVINKKENYKNTLIIISGMLVTILIAVLLRYIAELGTTVNRMGLDVIIMNSAVFGEILFKFILPINITVLPVYSNIYTILGSMFLIIMIALPFILKKHSFNLYFGVIWFIISLAPTILVTTRNSAEWNQYLECRSYLPLIGLIVYFSELLKLTLNTDKAKSLVSKVLVILIIIFAAINLYESKNYKNGISFYESAVADFPDRSLYQEVLGNLYTENGMLSEAEKAYKNMIKANPNYSKNYLKVAEFYNKNKRHDSTAAYAYRSFAIDSNANAASLMINAFIDNKQVDTAIHYLNLIYKDSTRYPEAYLDLINLLINEKRFDEALVVSKERISQGYDKNIFIDIFYSWTQFFFEQKDNVGVIRTIEKVLEIEPNNLEAIKYLAESYRNAGLYEKSNYYFNKLSEKNKKF